MKYKSLEEKLSEIPLILTLARQTVARGWCHKETEKKVMDVILAEAISYEVAKTIMTLV